MSDLDDDFLALAEGRNLGKKSTTKPKRKRSPKQDESGSDMDLSDSDEDAPPARKAKRGGDAPSSAAPTLYPLEGKYKNSADRAELMRLPEFEREAILGERADEINAANERLELSRMVKDKDGAQGAGALSSDSDDDYGASRSKAGRDRKTTGTTSEKREGLEKLKRSRAEKGNQRAKRDESPDGARRRRDDDYGYSDESDSEEGEVKTYGERLASKLDKKAVETASLDEFRSVILTRSRLAKLSPAPWFKEWAEGGWIRYSVGPDKEGVPQYRLCRIVDVRDVPHKSYRVEGVSTTWQLKVEHGRSARQVTMEGISDSPATDREILRVQAQLKEDKMAVMTSKEANKLRDRLDARQEYTMTEADLSAILAKKGSAVNPAQGKAKLLIQRDFARNSGDVDLLAKVEAELAKFDQLKNADDSAEQERARKLNERNRANNRQEIKKAESKAQAERSRQAAAIARGDQVKVDPSARVKTMTRLTYDREGSGTPSRPSTPIPKMEAGTSAAIAAVAADSKPKAATKLEDMVASRVQVDLDLDF